MTVTMKNAYIGQPGTDGEIVYTCPASTVARVLQCTVCNDTTSAATITINKVPSGGSVGDNNLIINAKSIGSTATTILSELVGQVLDAGDTIVVKASVADQLALSIDVVEVT